MLLFVDWCLLIDGVTLLVAVVRRWRVSANADDVCGCSLFVVGRLLLVVC